MSTKASCAKMKHHCEILKLQRRELVLCLEVKTLGSDLGLEAAMKVEPTLLNSHGLLRTGRESRAHIRDIRSHLLSWDALCNLGTLAGRPQQGVCH